jgi:sterol desaturase/sphingolipid hydroxylase (fatty acid hydroxylase superfamily)
MLKIILVGAWFAALALGERLAPAAAQPNRGLRLVSNLGLWAANASMNPLLTLPIAAAAAAFNPWTRPELPLWAALTLDLLALDLWIYAWHRANHEWAPLWRFHRVHHLDQALDVTSGVRFHPGEVLISALARAPLIVAADIPLASVAVYDTLVLLAALFHHSNLRLPRRFEAGLRVFVVTPSHHWLHHHALWRDTDSNYATLLTLWDRLFGSWSPNQRALDMPIGVEGEPDAPLPALALAPFLARPQRDALARRPPGPNSWR